MSVHSFDTDVANMVGVAAATIAYNIQHWCEKNAANDAHQYEGRSWTYNSVSAFKELFPYLSPKQIRTALDKLESAGLVISGNFNKQGRDQTKWYSFVPEAVVKAANCPKGQMQLPKKASPFAPEGRPLPDRKPDNKPTERKVTRATKIDATWRPEEKLRQYALDQGIHESRLEDCIEDFVDYWSSDDAKPKKDWPATWRGHCRRKYQQFSRPKAQEAYHGSRSQYRSQQGSASRHHATQPSRESRKESLAATGLRRIRERQNGLFEVG